MNRSENLIRQYANTPTRVRCLPWRSGLIVWLNREGECIVRLRCQAGSHDNGPSVCRTGEVIASGECEPPSRKGFALRDSASPQRFSRLHEGMVRVRSTYVTLLEQPYFYTTNGKSRPHLCNHGGPAKGKCDRDYGGSETLGDESRTLSRSSMMFRLAGMSLSSPRSLASSKRRAAQHTMAITRTFPVGAVSPSVALLPSLSRRISPKAR